MTIQPVSPAEAQRLVSGGATLIDIRDSHEYAREHIPGAVNIPLARITELPQGPLVFHCRSGMRTESHAGELAAAAQGAPCHMVAGGIDAWRRSGLPTRIDRSRPIDIMRQVQLAAGGLVLAGIILGFTLSPGFFGLSAFVGAGLMMAGATGWCGMARLLGVLPWNRPAQGV